MPSQHLCPHLPPPIPTTATLFTCMYTHVLPLLNNYNNNNMYCPCRGLCTKSRIAAIRMCTTTRRAMRAIRLAWRHFTQAGQTLEIRAHTHTHTRACMHAVCVRPPSAAAAAATTIQCNTHARTNTLLARCKHLFVEAHTRTHENARVR